MYCFLLAFIIDVGTRGLSIRSPLFPFCHIHTFKCDRERIKNYIINNRVFKEEESIITNPYVKWTSQSDFSISAEIRQHIEVIEIGSFSGMNIHSFVLSGYPQLKKLLIGTMAFTCFSHCTKIVLGRMKKNIFQKYPFRISDCPCLTTIRLGATSCGNFNTVKVSNCPALSVFESTPYVFDYVFTFTISSKVLKKVSNRLRSVKNIPNGCSNGLSYENHLY